MSYSNIKLVICCALKAEAQPLIAHYQLQAQSRNLYHGGSSDNSEMLLLITGVGESAMSRGITMLAKKLLTPVSWLNIGIAGHRNLPVGEIIRVSKSSGQGRDYYPPLTVSWAGMLNPLQTVPSPLHTYPSHCAVDMEGAAFFAHAIRYTSGELVQSLKIISDTQQASYQKITTVMIKQLISQQLTPITRFADLLVEMTQSLPNQHALYTYCHSLIQNLHSTETQRQQLLSLIQTLRACGQPMMPNGLQHNSMEGLLTYLRKRVKNIPAPQCCV